MPPFIQNLLALPAKTKALLGVSAVAILAIAFIMLKIATAPAYALIASGLDPAQTGKITAALDEQGIAYELRNNGTALAVHEGADRRRRGSRWPAQGVQASGGGAQPGYELLDESKLGASQFQQQVTYQRALEGEVARTLARRRGRLEPDRADRAAAGRPLPGRGHAGHRRGHARQLRRHAGAGRRARHGADVVASSVKGLKTENVTITDSSGAVLWPSDEAGGAAGGGSTQAERRGALRPPDGEPRSTRCSPRRSARTRRRSRSTPTSTWTRPREEELTYAAPRARRSKTTEETEKLEGGAAARRRHRRHRRQRPDLLGRRATAAAPTRQLQAQEDRHRLRRQQEDHQDARWPPGAVNKLNVALLVDKSVPADVFDSLEQTVRDGRRHRHGARRHDHRRRRWRSPRPETPKAGPVPDHAARPAQVGRPRPRRAAVPVLHDPRDEEAREREPRHAGAG